jgi:hypothetical protein
MNRSLFAFLQDTLTRRPSARPREAKRREARPTAESLEGRQLMSWSPNAIPGHLSLAGETTVLNFTSNALNGTGAIQSSTDVRYTSFVAPRSGSYTFEMTAQTPGMRPIFGIYNSSGNFLAGSYATNTNATWSVYLTQGERTFFEKTNETNSAIGSYTWSVQGPSYYTGNASDGQTTGEAHLVGNTLTLHMISATSPNAYTTYTHNIAVGFYDKNGHVLTTTNIVSPAVLTSGKYSPGHPTSISDRYWTYDVSNLNLTNLDHITVWAY